MRYLGHHADAAYPGYSSDLLDAFRHLARDPQSFGADFMFGDGETIIAASKGPYVGGLGAFPILSNRFERQVLISKSSHSWPTAEAR